MEICFFNVKYWYVNGLFLEESWIYINLNLNLESDVC